MCTCQARNFLDFQIGTFCKRARCKSSPKSLASDNEFSSVFAVVQSQPPLLSTIIWCQIWCQWPRSYRTQCSDRSGSKWKAWVSKPFLAGQVQIFENFLTCSQCQTNSSSWGRTLIFGGKPVQWIPQCLTRFGSGDFVLWMPTGWDMHLPCSQLPGISDH